MIGKRSFIISMMAVAINVVMAQSLPVVATDDNQEETRRNPELGDWSSQKISDEKFSEYPFLNLEANYIDLNGADWSDLRRKFASVDDDVVSIVHIGDSHLQAEGATTRTRALLQNEYGSSGRGLITPFKLAGTNQPLDYTITSDAAFTTAMLMRKPWNSDMGFTGISLTPKADKFDFTISTKPVDGREQDFDYIKVFCRGGVPSLLSASNPKYPAIKFATKAYGDTLGILLYEPVTSVRLDFEKSGKLNIFGFKLENSMTGVEYHVIGNNGARYDTYNTLGNIGNDIKALSPDLVMISMGANEAFGTISDISFYNNIDRLVTDILSNNPSAEILLVTPAECQRKDSGGFRVNNEVKRLRNVILKYGKDTGTPVYDWYEVAGGDGSSAKWIEKGFFAKDRIHNSFPGYDLQGRVFYEALKSAVDPQ